MYGIQSENTLGWLIVKMTFQPYFQTSLSLPDFLPTFCLEIKEGTNLQSDHPTADSNRCQEKKKSEKITV